MLLFLCENGGSFVIFIPLCAGIGGGGLLIPIMMVMGGLPTYYRSLQVYSSLCICLSVSLYVCVYLSLGYSSLFLLSLLLSHIYICIDGFRISYLQSFNLLSIFVLLMCCFSIPLSVTSVAGGSIVRILMQVNIYFGVYGAKIGKGFHPHFCV